MQFLKAVILLSCSVGFIFATCPAFEYMPAINLPLHAGDWFIHGVISDSKVNSACIKVGLTSNAWGSFPVNARGTVSGKNLSDLQPYTEVYDARISGISLPGRWTVDVDGEQYEFAILHTDYVEYSLTATCPLSANSTDTIQIQFASRTNERPMPMAEIEILMAKIRDSYGVTGTFQRVLQSAISCE
ncbi:hypothetical protein Ocin01_14686 [Orchesella cincta]|uniref:Lipocalin/cytosolic fatty-acid binding domain-containing protein n=1 Tax=Orchesella cincta TaxID=48709 RepID=A0A1D2MG64_ORCCI|nr:hypothetical protein Ocin01_14686 [Orchesella cincta]